MSADFYDFPCPSCGEIQSVAESELPADGELTCKDCKDVIRLRSPAPNPQPRMSATIANLPRDRASDSLIRIEEWEDDEPSSAADVSCPSCGHRFDPSRSRPGRPNILIVEDTDFFLHLAVDVLARDFETTAARTVREARDLLKVRTFDLIVLDLTLSDAEGVDVLKALDDKSTPVLLYTSRDETALIGEEWARLRELGASDVIHKGINIEEVLLQKVEDLLAGAPGRV